MTVLYVKVNLYKNIILYKPVISGMRQDISTPTEIEIIDEAECARRLLVRRETLQRWRKTAGMPYVPLSDKRRAHVRYVWPDVVVWLRSLAKGQLAEAPKRRGRPRNVERAAKTNEGGRP